MMELTSPHRKNGSSRDHYYGSSQDDRQINCGVYDPPSLPGNKAPVTVLHHRPTS
uniref:Uncharacterized protein n=1 Tax=Ciona savignyi TaxID=51511 RepID=H2ZJ10_CIOSA